VDPDAPSRLNPTYGQWLHWLVVNLTIESFGTLSVPKGTTLMPYMSPGPPNGTGKHRYVFLLYEQPSDVNPSKTQNKLKQRQNFKARDFANQARLKLVAANYFFAENK
ncbi:hypothetical protein BGZ52_012263, partial [Haplosporangium bisporale]